MSILTSLSDRELRQFWGLVHESIGIRRHIDLLRWLQGDLQRFLAHDIMIAARGDFGLGLIHYDIVSLLPGVRTERADADTLAPLLHGLFERWIELGKAPYALGTDEAGFLLNNSLLGCALGEALQSMRHRWCMASATSAAATTASTSPSARTRRSITSDAAPSNSCCPTSTPPCRVPHLPRQYRTPALGQPADAADAPASANSPGREPTTPPKPSPRRGLRTLRTRGRDHALGQHRATNAEIGSILDISAVDGQEPSAAHLQETRRLQPHAGGHQI